MIKNFFKDEKSGGLVLILSTVCSILLANSVFSMGYNNFWHQTILGLSVEHWINDGLISIFFLMVGLELKRELYVGEFSKPKNAILPVAAAIGGMLVPAGLYFSLNNGLPTQSGIGIPMATDIAFALGILSLLGKRVPASLKIFLMALAVVDDLGAIVVIAIFYTKDLILSNLGVAIGVFAVLILLNRLKINMLVLYLIGGIVMWYFMLSSGIHATITGVLLAFTIPFNEGALRKNLSSNLLHKLHLPVTFLILPIFALANTAIVITGEAKDIFTQPVSIGVMLGLVVGKPIGIFAASFLVSKGQVRRLPNETSWFGILGAGLLGGIGFTMSIFITLLAFDDVQIINTAKIAILASSLLAGILGFIFLRITLKKENVSN